MKSEKLKKLRDYVDGEADTPYEYFMLFAIVVNTVSLGWETSRNISDRLRNTLFVIDQICLVIFVAELLFKFVVYNKDFFGEKCLDEDGVVSFHLNRWNISDLIIVLVSVVAMLPYFAVFRAFRIFRSFKVIKSIRSLRIVKAFKLVNGVSSLRETFKGLIKAIPGIIWTFSFLSVFAYVYAIIGTNIFRDDFPLCFGDLEHSLLTLCQIITFDSWVSQITRPIVQAYPLAWLYFVSYAFIAAYVLMNVIVGIIVNAMGTERDKHKKEKKWHIDTETIEALSLQIESLKSEIQALRNELKP